MNLLRRFCPFVPVAMGLGFAAGTLALAACSSVNPNPPDPHEVDDPPYVLDPAILDPTDGGADATDAGADADHGEAGQ